MQKTQLKLFLMLVVIFVPKTWAQGLWERDVEVHSPRENIYGFTSETFQKKVMEGRRVALFYPVTVSDLLIPYHPIKNFFEKDPADPVRKKIFELLKTVSPYKSMDDVFASLGVHDYPVGIQSETPNPLPPLTAAEQELPMGATIIHTPDGDALTFGCAACHASDLFGVKVLGLTNRFPRSNDFFRKGKTFAPYVNSFLFRDLLKTTEGERLLMARAKEATKWVGTKEPTVLGLDTSLAQVALSLSRRNPDAYATRGPFYHRFPRKNKLATMVADSKPAVWWNVKYKNRWLSDGSIVSGNPVHTNFLWNEIGRGTDLKKLEVWLKNNQSQIEALTSAVFASRAPRYEKFFGAESINLELAQKGQKHFVVSCQKCHGAYEKAWDLPESKAFSLTEKIQTVKIIYHTKTPVKDVGTDSGRYLGMREFAADLNRLAISKSLGTVVEPQKGYVPPPLEGIWARWPYFHNNSIPNLCALLTPAKLRPVTYVAGPAIDRARDFDQDCVGYPLGDKTPDEWKKNPNYFYDTKKEGLKNSGHDEGILMKNGVEIYSESEKHELIEFLKTL